MIMNSLSGKIGAPEISLMIRLAYLLSFLSRGVGIQTTAYASPHLRSLLPLLLY
jgi:hypothetical protein